MHGDPDPRDDHPHPVTHPALDASRAQSQLNGAELEITGRLLEASNATFLSELRPVDGPVSSWVYKPTDGERPLWDFPRGTLGLREVAAYEVSRIGGFDCVPVTVLADGPLGPGSLQAWIESEPEAVAELVDLVPVRAVPSTGWFTCVEGTGSDDRPVAVIHADDPRLRMLAVFDVLVNNADRKGGHILASRGQVFGVDHGISFHTEHKLRTLLWGWAGSPLHDVELEAIQKARDEAPEQLTELLDEMEIAALVRRADLLLSRHRMPRPRGQWPSIPWPPF